MTTVYYADVSPLNNDTIYNAALALIGPEMQKKSRSLKHRSDRNLSVGARLLLVHSLRERGINVDELEFRIRKGGKPYISNIERLQFSLSHSGDMAVCAVSDLDVGVDTEQTGTFNPDICKRFFNKSEYSAILANSDKQKQQEVFFRLWTLKESYVKMTGSGIGGFADCVIDTTNEPRIILGEADAGFREWSVGGYRVALCSKADVSDVELKRINLIKMLII